MSARKTHYWDSHPLTAEEFEEHERMARRWGAKWIEESGQWLTPRVGVRGHLAITFVEPEEVSDE
jgi:hypothetical protein